MRLPVRLTIFHKAIYERNSVDDRGFAWIPLSIYGVDYDYIAFGWTADGVWRWRRTNLRNGLPMHRCYWVTELIHWAAVRRRS